QLAEPRVRLPHRRQHHLLADVLGWRLLRLAEGDRYRSEHVQRQPEAIEAGAEVGAGGGHADGDGGCLHIRKSRIGMIATAPLNTTAYRALCCPLSLRSLGCDSSRSFFTGFRR